jgi:uncharacterized membrane protein
MTGSVAATVAPPGESPEVRAAAVERLTFFADAVVAIAITLLALELPVPEGRGNAELLRSAGGHAQEYIAFLVSFLVVAAHWAGHHRLFRYVTAMREGLRRITMFWLLALVLTPFATKVLGGAGAFQARFILYAGVQAAAALLAVLMVRHVRRHGELRADTPPGYLRHATVRGATVAAAFLVSVPLCFVSKPAAYACWAVVPVGGRMLRAAARRRRATRPRRRPRSR